MTIDHRSALRRVTALASPPVLEVKRQAIRNRGGVRCKPSVLVAAALLWCTLFTLWSAEQPITGYLTKEAHGVVALGVFTGTGMDGPLDAKPQGPVRLVTVYSTPNSGATVLLKLSRVDDVDSVDVSCGIHAAVVYDRRPGWYQIKTRAGRGWVAQAESGVFTAVEDLVRDTRSYLIVAPQWNRLLFRQPSLSAASVTATAPATDVQAGQVPATLLEWKWVEGQVWIKIRIHPLSFDDPASIEDQKSGTVGWLPAYHENQFIMWFFTCC